jgi:hypothetical protein
VFFGVMLVYSSITARLAGRECRKVEERRGRSAVLD